MDQTQSEISLVEDARNLADLIAVKLERDGDVPQEILREVTEIRDMAASDLRILNPVEQALVKIFGRRITGVLERFLLPEDFLGNHRAAIQTLTGALDSIPETKNSID